MARWRLCPKALGGCSSNMAKIGIFAGTFDPVHNGHVAFALSAIESLGLDAVAFLPERKPRGKQGVTDISHRINMLKIIARHPRLEVMVLPDARFTVGRTLPQLQERYKRDELTLLVGSDIAQHLMAWPEADRLLGVMRIAVGQRAGVSRPRLPVAAELLPTMQAHVAASDIRSGRSEDIAPGVRAYIRKHHLYGV